jgi:hypothetical protein
MVEIADLGRHDGHQRLGMVSTEIPMMTSGLDELDEAMTTRA